MGFLVKDSVVVGGGVRVVVMRRILLFGSM